MTRDEDKQPRLFTGGITIIAVLLCLCLAGSAFVRIAKAGAYTPPVLARLALPFLNSAASVTLVQEKSVMPVEVGRALVLTQEGRQTVLKRFLQLQGFVKIDSPDAALSYVRMDTVPAFYFYWRHGQNDAEIMSKDEAAAIPTYGLSRRQVDDFGLAELPADLYAKHSFAPPTLTQSSGHFEVVRWIFVNKGFRYKRIEKIREIVGSDGSYNRQILFSELPPPTPSDAWIPPMLE